MSFTMAQVTRGEAEEIAAALHAIATRSWDYAVQVADIETKEVRAQITTCMACGCLVLLDEVCPGCRARKLGAA